MRSAVLLALLIATPLSAQTFDVTGYVAARGINATGPASWLEGGAGRLEAGGDRDDFMAVAQAGVDWRPSRFLDVHVSGTARHDPDEFGGRAGGLIEAYATAHVEFGLDALQLRAGHFFLPTSRENVDPLWASPYTIHFSALNTWIGQEVRPVGVDLQYRHTTGRGHAITGGATAFRGNDTMGTLLAWRGWTVGSRISTYGEVLPLPPIPSLGDDGAFSRQRDDGTKPIGQDLDGNTGYSARLRYAVPQRGSVQYTFVDNAGDRALYRGEYSWDTSFHLLGVQLGDPDRFVVAAEYMRGSTAMGLFVPYVEADFDAGYLLVSAKRNRQRFSARFEVFGTDERDFTAAEFNEESLRSWTFSYFFEPRERFRLGAELTQVTGARRDTADPDGRSITLEARYNF